MKRIDEEKKEVNEEAKENRFFVHTENGMIRMVLPPESSFVWKNLLPPGSGRERDNYAYNFS